MPWIAAAGLALGVAGIMASRRAPRASGTVSRRIALIGDSYAVGLGPELVKLLPGFRFEPGPTAFVGASTKEVADALPGWLSAYQPTLTLVTLGVNGAANPADFHAVVGTLGGIGSKVVWIGPPAGVRVPWVDMPAVRGVIASLGVPTVPATNVALRPEQMRQTTVYLHPQVGGYSQWAREIANVVG